MALQSDASSKHLMLLPGPKLVPLQGQEGWRSIDGFAEFHVASLDAEPIVPAGWYVVSMETECLDAEALRPELRLDVAAGDASVGPLRRLLPAMRGQASVETLLRIEFPVTALRMRPTDAPARFRIQSMGLRRLSRRQALSWMLGGGGAPGWGFVRNAGRFAIKVLRGGLARAVESTYGEYRSGQLPPPPEGYLDWVSRFDTLDDETLSRLAQWAEELSRRGPLISIVLPVYQTPERWLRRCLDSVQAQLYANWELCVSDDASADPRVMEVVREYAAEDPRIRFVRRDVNGHISESSNSALSLATGEYVSFLDHDDELRPHALLEMAAAIDADPALDLLYSDEDKIDGDGKRFDPYFKPDWNPDLLRAQNYLCHFTVVRRSLVEQAGRFRPSFEGAQDHDLFLRCAERTVGARIRHVPRVLYHWRAIAGSTALARGEKDYASSAGERAVQSHLDRIAPGAHVEVLPRGHYRVAWPLPAPAPKVSILIPTRDHVDLLRQCVSSIVERTTYPDYEIVIVDNQSSQADALRYLDEVRSDQRIKVLKYDAPFNFSAINNAAVDAATGSIVCLLNNDIEVISPGWLEEMAGHASRPDIGAVGAMLYYPNDLIQHGGVLLGIGGVANHAFCGEPRGYGGHGGRALVAQNVSAVTAACLMVRREVYLQVGGMDERLAVAFNDVDFCLRVREQGYRNLWTPHAELYHHESASRGAEDNPEKVARFAREVAFMQDRWGHVLQDDPAYNPNLTLAFAMRSFDLAWPPRVHWPWQDRDSV
ncbi:MAG: glycosyltransferase family 2 protein [Luteimonas sp.]|nr:glycosyltransferase family 2 protein [Luteimonas sp.]